MKEVTIKIEDDAYNHFKALAEICERPIDYVIALAAYRYFNLWSKGEIQKENGVTAHHDR